MIRCVAAAIVDGAIVICPSAVLIAIVVRGAIVVAWTVARGVIFAWTSAVDEAMSSCSSAVVATVGNAGHREESCRSTEARTNVVAVAKFVSATNQCCCRCQFVCLGRAQEGGNNHQIQVTTNHLTKRPNVS